jgi:hypothetical protein
VIARYRRESALASTPSALHHEVIETPIREAE